MTELGISELISRCKAGDRQALHLLYQQYRPGLLKICRHYAKEESVAEDLLHDAFVVILTSLDKQEQIDNLESWMTVIVKNVGYHYRQYLKKEQTVLKQMDKEDHQDTEKTLIPDYDQLQTFISQLPNGYQQVFRLSVFEGLSHQEISQLLGIAPHSSSSQLAHAKHMLRMLIKQSWMLMLLLIAIPTAMWLFTQKETLPEQRSPLNRSVPKKHLITSIKTSEDHPVYTQLSTPFRKRYRKALILDSLQSIIDTTLTPVFSETEPYLSPDSTIISQTEKDVLKENSQKDTAIYHHSPWEPVPPYYIGKSGRSNRSWEISLVYHGQIRHDDDIMGTASFGINSPDPHGNTGQNTIDNDEVMEARYEHQSPITMQLMLSRMLNKKVSLETGLSYTILHSTITTGGTQANIQKRQKLRYLGIPIRFGWQWYKKGHLSLYSSGGAMIEVPLHSTVVVRHLNNGIYTFQKETSPKVPVQWSASFGLGIQYDLTPNLGVYIEPNTQYFFKNDDNLKTYRTEHPLEITLPFGLRFSW